MIALCQYLDLNIIGSIWYFINLSFDLVPIEEIYIIQLLASCIASYI